MFVFVEGVYEEGVVWWCQCQLCISCLSDQVARDACSTVHSVSEDTHVDIPTTL